MYASALPQSPLIAEALRELLRISQVAEYPIEIAEGHEGALKVQPKIYADLEVLFIVAEVVDGVQRLLEEVDGFPCCAARGSPLAYLCRQ